MSETRREPEAQSTASADGCVAMFLGHAAAKGGPYALLGLTPEDRSDSMVLLQLQRQLGRITSHPLANSPEADELRLLLHAAAAELVTAGDARDTLAPSPAALVEPAPEFPLRGAVDLDAEAAGVEAMAIINACGGLTPDARLQLMRLSASTGVPVARMMQLASVDPFAATLQQTPVGTSPPSRVARRPTVPASRPLGPSDARAVVGVQLNQPSPENVLSDQQDPAGRQAKLAVVGAGIGVVVLIVIATSIAWLTRVFDQSPTNPATAAPAVTAREPATPPEVFPAPRSEAVSPKAATSARVGDKAPAPSATSAGMDYSGWVRRLLADVERIGSASPDDVARFASAIEGLSRTWTEAAADQLLAGQDAAMEYIYRASARPADGVACVEAIRAVMQAAESSRPSASAISPAVWASGLMARLGRERELPAAVIDAVRQSTASRLLVPLAVGDSSFNGGVRAAISAIGDGLTPTKLGEDESGVMEAVRAWDGCVGAAPISDAARNLVRLRAIEAILARSLEPTQSRSVFDAIGFLTNAVTWRRDDDSRQWLLRWCDSPEISAADLRSVMLTLANRTAAEGVDITSVPSASASLSDRAALRDRLREAWGLDDPSSRVELLAAWRHRLDEQLSSPSERASVAGRLTRAWNWSRLSLRAEQLFVGDWTDLELKSDPFGSNEGDSGRRRGDEIAWRGDSSWAVRYIAARSSIGVRSELLREYSGVSPCRAIDAELIVAEAVRGAPAEIRRSAQIVVRARANEPVFINALLELIPSVPATNDNNSFLSEVLEVKLPSAREASWRLEARRATIERLLAMISDRGELLGVDRLGDLLAECYGRRLASMATLADPSGSDEAKPTSGSSPTDSVDASAGSEVDLVLAEQRPVEMLAAMLRSRLQREAAARQPTGRELYTPDVIQSRHATRVRAAAGRLQALVAEQLAIFDYLAYITVTEDASRSSSVAEVDAELQAAVRRADHVAEQIEAAERAMAILWGMRLEGAR